jgi:hypothetical protein
MQYRTMKKLGVSVSALGFGCMRFPTVGTSGTVDEEAAIAMLHHAMDSGVNYLDTAYIYHNGESEKILGRAIQGYDREKLFLATKLPLWEVHQAADIDRIFNQQLERLQQKRIDFYLLHCLGTENWKTMQALGIKDWIARKKAQGAIRFIGFSFHESLDSFKGLVDTFDQCDFCQIQYNYMNEQHQAGTAGLAYAAAAGLPVVIMEPLLGGRLARLPADATAAFDSFPVKRSAAEWALQWLWNKPAVSLVLSGMSSMEQVTQNLTSAAKAAVNSLSAAELAAVENVRTILERRKSIPCTKCGYCMPCPNGVEIPRNFELYNEGICYDDFAAMRWPYNHELKAAQQAANCIACRVCEEKCPQQIKISALMPGVHTALKE